MAGLTPDSALRAAAVVGSYLSIFSATLVFAPKNAIITRLASTALLIGLWTKIWDLVQEILPYTPQHYNVGIITMVSCVSGAEAILLSRIDANDLSGGDEKAQPGTLVLLWRAVCIQFNLRRVGTRWEISSLHRRKPQSRARFLASNLSQLALVYLLIDAIMMSPLPEEHLITKDKQTLSHFGNLSVDDVIFRLVAVIVYWATSYTVNRLNVGLVMGPSVLLGLASPSSWPYTNGSVGAIYTVRGFWGIFWHQQLRHVLTSWSDFTSDRILCLPRGTLISRYTRLFLAFFLSGALHHFPDLLFGLDPWEFSAIKFFCLQALGIMFEDGVQAVTKSWAIPRPLRRTVGYVWTVFWFWWTTPLWFYPTARMGAQGAMVPVAVVKPLLARFGVEI